MRQRKLKRLLFPGRAGHSCRGCFSLGPRLRQVFQYSCSSSGWFLGPVSSVFGLRLVVLQLVLLLWLKALAADELLQGRFHDGLYCCVRSVYDIIACHATVATTTTQQFLLPLRHSCARQPARLQAWVWGWVDGSEPETASQSLNSTT